MVPGEWRCQELKSERMLLLKQARKESSRFSSCCDYVASSLDEIEASKSMATIAGKKCTIMAGGGLQKASSLLLNGYSARM